MVYLPHWPIPSTLGNRKIDYETVFERAKIVLKKLGDPHKNLPKVIHVAGTNGKGSTASLVAKIFQCHGYSTHLYTSPHLIDCNERILLNGQKISDQNLYFAMEKTRINSQNVDLTFMEAFTIGAFVAFAENPADVLVVECGMGARIDITNIIEEKIATIITAISLDHTEYLGDTIRKIAFEKSFLMRDKTPLIVALQPLEVSQILKLIADDKKFPAILLIAILALKSIKPQKNLIFGGVKILRYQTFHPLPLSAITNMIILSPQLPLAWQLVIFLALITTI
jgi:dihydrofolate synthase/folylpolyglutamate synthase